MRLIDLKKLVMQQLGFQGYDFEEEVDGFEPALTAYLNQAYREVFQRYRPDGDFAEMKDGGDVPDFQPGAYHVLLAYYAAARILSSERGEKQTRAQALEAEYHRLLAAIRRENYKVGKLVNKY